MVLCIAVPTTKPKKLLPPAIPRVVNDVKKKEEKRKTVMMLL
jgi:hypothetical protein